MADDLISRIGQVAQQSSNTPDLSSRISAVASGKTDAPPTDEAARMEAYFHSNPDFKARLLHSYNEVKEGVTGMAKSAGETLLSGDNLVRSGLNKLGANYPQLTPEDFGGKADSLELKNQNEKGGAMAEQIAEFMMGDAAVAKGVSAATKLGMVQKVVKLAEESPYVAKVLHAGFTALRQGAVGTTQGLAHGEDLGTAGEQGAITGLAGGAVEGLVQGAGALKNAITKAAPVEEAGAKFAPLPATEATNQAAGQEAIRNVAKDTAEKAGVSHVEPSSIQDVFSRPSEEIQAKAKDLYRQIDEATGGKFQPIQNALQENKMSLRGATTDEEVAQLTKQRADLEAKQEQVFKQAETGANLDVSKFGSVEELYGAMDNPIDMKSTVEQARQSYKQATALEDVSRSFQKPSNVSGVRPEDAAGTRGLPPESVYYKGVARDLQKLRNSGRLEEALGKEGAASLTRVVNLAANKTAEADTLIEAVKSNVASKGWDIAVAGKRAVLYKIASNPTAAKTFELALDTGAATAKAVPAIVSALQREETQP